MASVWVGSRGTIKDFASFSAQRDARELKSAIKGLGTSEQVIIGIVTTRSNTQRQLICKEYKATCEEDLIKDLKGDLSGSFKQVITGLVMHPAAFDTKQLHKAMKGSGTKESCLIEILASRNNKQMKEILHAYMSKHKRRLADDITSDTSGDFNKVLLTLSDGTRDEGSKVDGELAKTDAKILYDAGEKKWGTDEAKFIDILCLRSIPQLKKTFDEYKILSNKAIEESIKSEMSGHLEDLLLAIVQCVRNTPAFFAEKLYNSMKGAGTDETTLTRIMVSRSEIDLLDIRAEYKKMYGCSVYSSIQSETSGDYMKTLLKICGGED
ncbi:annexin A3 [Latimeria chalumnae]|uniref:Annexin n=1 Tax=Latimeria chalumnae TaxID=7897 RepID=H2ZUH7_LATCH|nr:PREDICTED: annexin A3 [Latimeria chalumnae]|eukprot:XP_006013315.1 PREDICTED: annexin A3 [Latimeria chalumnae]